ncbi:TPA: zeta toxin family protein [Streptococcus suis]|nr:zeta toxin family protein [Streptococcus suis]
MGKPQYIIVAGVNGAGKSSLYRLWPWLFKNTRRINADEWLQKHGGDWREPKDNIKAMKAVVKDLRQALENGESIHQETTLAGTGQTFLNLIEKAHQKGYEVTVLYVNLDSPERAIDRVAARVKKGGHGVDSDLIRKRYDSSKDNFKKVAKVADNVLIFDNNKNFIQTYERRGEKVLYDIRNQKGRPAPQKTKKTEKTNTKHL